MSNDTAMLLPKKENRILKLIVKYPILPTLAFFILMVIVFVIVSPTNKAGENIFLSPVNLANIAEATAGFSVGAFGMTLVLLVGCIDLSTEAVIALSSVTLSLCLEQGLPVALAVLITLAVGMICGLINSLLVIKFNVAPFLATVAVALVYTGAAFLLCGSRTIRFSSPGFTRIFGSMGAGATFLGLPMQLLWTVFFLVIMYLLISKSKFGRWAQATGGNIQAAYSSGVNVNLTRMVAFLVMGVLAAFVGIMISGRLSSGTATFGSGYGLKLIIAAVLGGTSFTGDGGSVFGALLGSLVMGVLSNGLGIIGINTYVQQIITGVVIVAAVVFSVYLSKKR